MDLSGKVAREIGAGAALGYPSGMSLFLTIALVHIVALITPGPDFFFVSQLAASRSRREALAGVVGPLIEVPVLVGLVYVSLALRRRFADQHQAVSTGQTAS